MEMRHTRYKIVPNIIVTVRFSKSHKVVENCSSKYGTQDISSHRYSAVFR